VHKHPVSIALTIFVLFQFSAGPALAGPSDPDSGFGDNGVVIEDLGSVETGGTILQLSTGKLLLVGNGTGTTGAHSFTRYKDDGEVDTSHGSGGTVAGHDGSLLGITLLPDDGLLVASDFSTGNLTHLNDAAVMRYTATGAKDGGFGTMGRATFRLDPDVAADEHATHVTKLASGKLLVVGYLWRGGANFDIAAVRLTSTGTLDTTFADDGYFLFDFLGGIDKPTQVLELPDKRLILYGEVTDTSTFGEPSKVLFMRLTEDGDIDTTFGPSGTGITTIITDVNSDTPGAMVRLANGKFVFGIGGTALWTVGRLTENGVLDTDFGTGGVTKLTAVFPDVVFAAAQTTGLDVQTDGRIVVNGSLTGFNAQFQVKYAIGLARFQADGDPDTTLNNGSAQRLYQITEVAPEVIAGVLVQTDGRIVMGGSYPNGVDDRWMMRVNGDEPVPVSTTTTLPEVTCGDANGDGVVNVADALATLRAAVGLGICPLSACDTNGDGVVNTGDALRVLRRAVGQDIAMNCIV
jgi:uncharacterized delta-60 repeat protein